jgi:6-phosphogluconolactonase
MARRRIYPSRAGKWSVLLVIAACVAVALPTAAVGKPKPGKHKQSKPSDVVGAVYSQTNDTSNNEVVVFDRLANGQLTPRGSVSTGGQGGLEDQHGCGANCPFLDTQGEVTLTRNERLLFVVNAGSDTISSFRVTKHGLKLADEIGSNGDFPYSVTTHKHKLYVLNEKSLSIAGFRFTGSGKMRAIKGSVRNLSPGSQPGANGPRQIQFDRTGRTLAVTILAPAVIDTFAVNHKGIPGQAKANPSTSPLPFGFDFDPQNRLVVSQVHDLNGTPTGDTATYNLSGSGAVTPIDTEGSNGFAPCWLDISSDGRYVYVVNTGAGTPSGATVSVYSLSPSGNLTLIQVTAKDAPGVEEFAMTDDALSRDDRYLYVVVPGVFGPSRIDIFQAGSDGKLTFIGATARNLAPGLSGVAAA